MKINSNTVKLEKDEFKQIEDVVKKIATENKIDDVESISIQLDPDRGLVKFKEAWNGSSNPKQEEETLEATQNDPESIVEEKEDKKKIKIKNKIIFDNLPKF